MDIGPYEREEIWNPIVEPIPSREPERETEPAIAEPEEQPVGK